MDITCVSDLHGHYPKLEGGDLLIVAGDLTARDTHEQHIEFSKWVNQQDYKKIIIIGGNHDSYLIEKKPWKSERFNSEYLCDSGTEFECLNIWGSPWTLKFEGMNPKCMAFTCDTEKELAEKWAKIPHDTDILITHGPPYGILDTVYYEEFSSDSCHTPVYTKNVGSKSLALKIGNMEKPPKLWVWGHIHEAYGIDLAIRSNPCKMINCSLVNERYQPVNKPVRVTL